MRKSWHPARSPDVQFTLRPYWMFSRGTTMTTHGSPYDYDTHVPLLFYGPAWIHPWRADSRVEMSDLAPTLARLLRVPAPSASEGHALDLGGVP
jgi:arylsulfatase A-like enzyme